VSPQQESRTAQAAAGLLTQYRFMLRLFSVALVQGQSAQQKLTSQTSMVIEDTDQAH
jgi:hypothetical protein